jgi:site-specific DNA-cytosine methylase
MTPPIKQNPAAGGGSIKPLAIDLCCGLGGWAHGLLAEGWEVIGYDIERHKYGDDEYPGQLIIQDVLTLDGHTFRGKASLVVASPPCTEFSYMAMPWSRAKQIRNALLGRDDFPKGYKGSRTKSELTTLFDACFRIGREAGCPTIIENVRGAQEWVGAAARTWGSFYLWGDVPALMPIPAKLFNKMGDSPGKIWSERPKGNVAAHREGFNAAGIKAGDRNKAKTTGGHKWSTDWSNQTPAEGNKTVGMNWSDQTKRGQDFTRIAGNQAGQKLPSENGRRTNVGTGARFTTDCDGFKDFQYGIPCQFGSKSKKRKQASAEIAKIPPTLAQWIARVFKPRATGPNPNIFCSGVRLSKNCSSNSLSPDIGCVDGRSSCSNSPSVAT